MATVSTKRQRTEQSMKVKGVPHTIHMEKNKAKLIEFYESGFFGVKTVRPETYENLNKALTKWFLMLRTHQWTPAERKGL